MSTVELGAPAIMISTPLTYLTFDSMAEGVGLSQVLPYVERLSRRGLDVTLHSFEKRPPGAEVGERLRSAGVRWAQHPFGLGGARGGVGRVLRGARIVAGVPLVHARSDLAAASCLIARCPVWVWDMRAFWREQRIEMGLLRPGSLEERVMRRVEVAAARESAAIVALSSAAVDVMARRHGARAADKVRVIPTCVDLKRFLPASLPPGEPLRFLLTGTLNDLYDIGSMTRLVERTRRLRAAELTILSPDAGVAGRLDATSVLIDSADFDDMPRRIGEHHVGLCLLRLRTRVSSTAAVPTKIGEYLACGRPVVVSAGLGDMDALLERHPCGVAVGDLSDAALDGVALKVEELLADPETPARCRALAEEHFDLERGVDELVRSYREALDRRKAPVN